MSTLPVGLAPMLASAGPLPADDDGWAYEIKWDGVRVLAAVEDGRVALTTRRGNQVSSHYPELADLAGQVGPHRALLDGEVVSLDADGRTDFGRLQSRMHVTRPGAALVSATPVAYLAFDLLHLDGRSMLAEDYDVRRAELTALLTDSDHCLVPPHFVTDGAAVARATREQGLEGVVAKRRDSRYEPGRRSDSWRKVKNVRRQSAVVVGWQPGAGARQGQVGSLLLAVSDGPDLVYAGRVGTGFSDATLRHLAQLLRPLRIEQPALAHPPAPAELRLSVWVRPELVVDVEYTEWTRDGRLRHPSYKGLRDDLLPADAVREP